MRRGGAACAVVSISITLAGDGERDFEPAARGEGGGDFDVAFGLGRGGTRNLGGRAVVDTASLDAAAAASVCFALAPTTRAVAVCAACWAAGARLRVDLRSGATVENALFRGRRLFPRLCRVPCVRRRRWRAWGARPASSGRLSHRSSWSR